ncbi:unnamed protein product [Adineta ricciae]|uniref:Uncharacterized protein n=1 Tax=Adineta ricciae TaxID=249248 RepID=A0A815KGM1_ADIRI|nr:unnamed protein product [Adineta ricciae]
MNKITHITQPCNAPTKKIQMLHFTLYVYSTIDPVDSSIALAALVIPIVVIILGISLQQSTFPLSFIALYSLDTINSKPCAVSYSDTFAYLVVPTTAIYLSARHQL